ncbi:hypothetical protein LRAMOSA00149 [Lichtheimia ramosa]|uniref:Uncharacterized protein n=1 Tax=Lichtheimia ramosa TaxID=688394 RepID=A0A077W7F6_9FUNG|nr:hypothetical protein LRAMOSA00149 [Lichtheimia ramosa]
MDFLVVVANNDIEKARQYIQSGIDVNSPILWNAKNTHSPVLPTDASNRPELREQIQSSKEYHSRPLNIAVIGGHADMVRLLLSAGADINLKDGRGRTALVCAIFGLDVDVADINTTNLPLISQTHPHHADIMKNILLVHPNLYVTTLDSPQYEIKGITPLCLASYLGKDELIQLLLEDGRVNVDGTDSKSATALMYAARDGNLPIVKTLLSYNASPDITDAHGWSAIQYAGRSPSIVQLYEEALRCKRTNMTHLYGSNMQLSKYPNNYTKLSTLLTSIPEYPSSLSHVKFDTLKDIDLLDPVGAPIIQIIRSAFLQAVKSHDHHTLQTLLLWSPPVSSDQRPLSGPLLVNYHDPKTGLTAVHYAMRTKPLPSLDTLILLYQAGADINSQTLLGRTALHHLARFGVDKDGKTWGIQKTSKHDSGGSAATVKLHRPVRMNSLSSLSSQPVDSNDNRYSSQSAVSSASGSSYGSNDISDPVARHIMAAPTVPQHLAMCASLLIRLGALVNIADPNGNTPLHFAAEFGGVPEVLEALIVEGNADVTLKNKKGMTPLDMCRTEEIRNRILALEHERKTKSTSTYASNNIKPFDTASDYKSTLSRSASRSTLQSAAAAARQQQRWNHSSGRRGSVPDKNSATSDESVSSEDEIERHFEKILKAFFSYQTTFTESIETALAKITDMFSSNVQMSRDEHVQSSIRVYGNVTRLRFELQQAHDMFDDTDQRVEQVMMHYRQELEQVEQIHQADWDLSELQCDKVEKLYDVFERIDGRFMQLELEQEELIGQIELMRKTTLRYSKSPSVECGSDDEFTGAMNNLLQSLVIIDTLTVDPALYAREDIVRLAHDLGDMVTTALAELDKKKNASSTTTDVNQLYESIASKWEKVQHALSKPQGQHDGTNTATNSTVVSSSNASTTLAPGSTTAATTTTPNEITTTTPIRPRHWEQQMTVARLYSHRKAAPGDSTLNELELSFEILHSNQYEIQKDLDKLNQQVAQIVASKRSMYDTIIKLENELANGNPQRPEADIRQEMDQVLLKTQALFDQHTKLENERTQLRTELDKVEKQVSHVRSQLRKTRPPLLLQGLLERLETDMGPMVRVEKDWNEDPSLVVEVFDSDDDETASSSSQSEHGGGGASTSSYAPQWLERFTSQLAVQCLVARLDASLFCLKVLAKNHIGRSRQILMDVQASLTQANAQLEETRNMMSALYDDAAEVVHQVFNLKNELETIVQHRKEEIVKVWEVVEEVSGGIDMSVIGPEHEHPPTSTDDESTTNKAAEDQDRHQWLVHELEQLQTVHENLQDAIEDLQRDQETIGQNLNRLANELIEPQVDKLVGQGNESLLSVSDRLAELLEKICQGEYGLLSTASVQSQPRVSKRFSVATQNSLRSSTSRPAARERTSNTRSSAAMSVRSKRMSVISTASFTSLSSYHQERMLARVSSLSSAFSRSQRSVTKN